MSEKLTACPECQGHGTNDDESEMCSTCDGDGVITREAAIRKESVKMLALINSGFVGVLPTGKIVDRREHPSAIPVPQNKLLGVPKPKKVKR